MVQIEVMVYKPLPEDVYDRIKLYRELSKKNHIIEINHFFALIRKGIYPYKCLECFSSGFSFCSFWLTNFNCETDKGNIVNDIERLL